MSKQHQQLHPRLHLISPKLANLFFALLLVDKLQEYIIVGCSRLVALLSLCLLSLRPVCPMLSFIIVSVSLLFCFLHIILLFLSVN